MSPIGNRVKYEFAGINFRSKGTGEFGPSAAVMPLKKNFIENDLETNALTFKKRWQCNYSLSFDVRLQQPSNILGDVVHFPGVVTQRLGIVYARRNKRSQLACHLILWPPSFVRVLEADLKYRYLDICVKVETLAIFWYEKVTDNGAPKSLVDIGLGKSKSIISIKFGEINLVCCIRQLSETWQQILCYLPQFKKAPVYHHLSLNLEISEASTLSWKLTGSCRQADVWPTDIAKIERKKESKKSRVVINWIYPITLKFWKQFFIISWNFSPGDTSSCHQSDLWAGTHVRFSSASQYVFFCTLW